MTHPAPTPLFQQTLHTLDRRPPEAIQALLERATGVVFAPLAERPASARSAALPVGQVQMQVQVRLTLDLLAAWPQGQHYRLTVDISAAPDALDIEAQRSVNAWLALWTTGLTLRPEPFTGTGSAERLQALLAAWAAEEARWNDVTAAQQAVLQGLRDGQVLRTSHKEGGTTIRFTGQRFLRVDHGDWPAEQAYDTDADCLAFLRQFYDYDTSRHVWPAKVPETAVWRLIYRQLDPVAGHGRRPHVLPMLLWLPMGCLLAAGLAWWKVHPKAEALRGGEVVITTPDGQPPKRDWQRLLDDQRRAVEAARVASR